MTEIRLVWNRDSNHFVGSGSEPSKQYSTANISGYFVKGPIPLDWLEQAARLPGKALATGLAVWFVVGLTGSNTVKLKRKTLNRFGIARQAFYRALEQLERAGLIAVERKLGQSPKITTIIMGNK